MLIDLNSDMGESFGAWKMGEDDSDLRQYCLWISRRRP
jgi:lactam utilization protein B